MKNYFLLILCLPFISFSQGPEISIPENLVEPNPYGELLKVIDNYVELNNVSSLTKINKTSNNKIIDTVSKQFFNKNGSIIKMINYEKNEPKDSTVWQYDSNNVIQKWLSYQNNTQINSIYKYNNNGQIQTFEKANIKSGESISKNVDRTIQTFNYEHNLLIEQITEVYKNNNIAYKNAQNYKYENKKPIIQITSFKSYTYNYFNNGKLREIKEFNGSEIDENKLYKVDIFNYNQHGKLSIDSMSYGKDLQENKYQIAKYKYKEFNINLLESINATYDGHYRNATFIYNEQEKLLEILIETDLRSTSKLKTWMHPKADYSGYPIKYKEQFEYDEYGNIKSNKKFANEKLILEIEYIMKYK
jgi:hypothetical protein